jgi:hypothetical protein
MTDYTDFDGAQARVSNGVLYITWTAPNTGIANLTITPVAQIRQVDWTEGDIGVVFYLAGHNPYVYCKKARELAEWVGKHLEARYVEDFDITAFDLPTTIFEPPAITACDDD